MPFSLDKPSVSGSKKRLLIQARPVGIPALYYWLNGALGRAIAHGRFDPLLVCLTPSPSSLTVLIPLQLACCLPPANLRLTLRRGWCCWLGWGKGCTPPPFFSFPPHFSTSRPLFLCVQDVGDGSASGWGSWSEVDGVAELALEEVGTQSSIRYLFLVFLCVQFLPWSPLKRTRSFSTIGSPI